MAKQSSNKDSEKRLLRKLAKAKLKLEVAEEKYAQSRVRGKQEIEQARLRAARWQTKAGERVQRRAEALARVEGSLSEPANADRLEPEMQSDDRVAERNVASPEAAAEILEQEVLEARSEARAATLLTPDQRDDARRESGIRDSQ